MSLSQGNLGSKFGIILSLSQSLCFSQEYEFYLENDSHIPTELKNNWPLETLPDDSVF